MILKEKIAIITGAAQGIGAAFALGYAKEGAKIVIADISDGKESVNAVEKAGGEALYAKTDVTKQDECEAMAKMAVERFGTIDILINNAAMYANIVKSLLTRSQLRSGIASWKSILPGHLTARKRCSLT